MYEGEIRPQAQRDGKGVYTFSNGDRDDGDWQDDKPPGAGSVWFAGSSQDYRGPFKHGDIEGYGK